MEKAIILASGLGTRMRPITDIIPKPLIKVGNKPLIETVIEGFQTRGIDEIIIIVGYMAEQFQYLKTKYKNVSILYNKYYESANNISSVYVARDSLKGGNCFICEADLFLRDNTILLKKLDKSCYFAKMVHGVSQDWVFEVDADGYINRIGKGGTDCYNMVGISYFLEKDARNLSKIIETEYSIAGNEKMFWDEAVNKHIGELRLAINEILEGQIIEVDTVNELETLRMSIEMEKPL